MRPPDAESPKRRHPSLLAWFIIGFIAVAVGIIFVCFDFIESLQDNSHKMRKYKIVPQLEAQDQLGLATKGILSGFDVEDQSAQKLFRDAQMSENKRDYKAAILLAEQSLKLYRESVKGKKLDILNNHNICRRLDLLAKCNFALGSYAKTVQYASQSITLNPSNGSAYGLRAKSYILLGKPDLARKDEISRDSLIPPSTAAHMFTAPDAVTKLGRTGNLKSKTRITD